MAKVVPGRVTAQIDGDFVVFLIGLRVNKPWKLHKWLPAFTFTAMPRMIRELEADPESGCLGHTMGFKVIVQYWRSFDHLEAYARSKDREHWPAWIDFNKRVGKSRGDVGIWHETYQVRAGEYEAVYSGMPPFGLGRVGTLVDASGARAAWRARRSGMNRTVMTAVGLALLVAGTTASDEWPQFRGMQAGVAMDHPALPERWSETENVVWKADIPGLGWSSPIVWGDHVFVTTAISQGEEPQPVKGLYDPGDLFGKRDAVAAHRWMVYDIDRKTGQVRWERELRASVPTIKRHIKASFASETPVTDGERVYVYFGSIGLVAALDMTGEVVWTQEVGAFNGGQEFAPAASPALHEDRLYIVNDNTTESFLVAFDTTTGEQVWRVAREETENWSTPLVWENDIRTEIVTTGRDKVRSYDLAGQQLWELTGMTVNTAPSPFAADGLVYLSSGYPGSAVRPVYAIRPGGVGDISLDPDSQTDHPYIAWFQPMLGTYVTSAIVYRGTYYTLLDRGMLLAHDARTGQEIYGRKRLKPGSGFTASPWAYNGKVFVLSEDGDTYVVQAGSAFEIVGTNSLDEMALATPAVAGDSLFIRTQTKLYRLSNR